MNLVTIYIILYISKELTNSICDIIKNNHFEETSILKEKYEQYSNNDFIFDFDFFFSEYSKGVDYLENGILIKDENPTKNLGEEINSDFEYYQKGADHGNPAALKNIGNLYMKGRFVEKDYSKALDYYQKAAQMGNGAAFNNIGQMYENGLKLKKISQNCNLKNK